MKRWVSSLWLLVLGSLGAAYGAIRLAAEMHAPHSLVPVILFVVPVAALAGFAVGRALTWHSTPAQRRSAEILTFAPRAR